MISDSRQFSAAVLFIKYKATVLIFLKNQV